MRRAFLDPTLWALMSIAVALTVAAPLIPGWVRFVAQISMATGLAALGVMILLRAGLLSFGQGLYYFVGAYAVALSNRHLGLTDTIAGVAIALLAAAIVGAIIGLFIARYRGIFFAMLTLALSMVGYGIAIKTGLFGGTDGLNIGAGSFFGYRPRGENLQIASFVLSIWTSGLVCTIAHLFIRSRIGKMSDAIGDNELRLEYLGLSVQNTVHLVYILAAGFAGAGGAIAGISARHVDPGFAYWTTAGEFVFIVLLSGQANVLAPFFGSALLEFVRSFAASWFPDAWQIVLGSAMLLVVMFLPKGLGHLVVLVAQLFKRRRAGFFGRRVDQRPETHKS